MDKFNEEFLRKLAILDPLLSGFLRGFSGAMTTAQGRTTTTKPSNTYEGKWRRVEKPRALPLGRKTGKTLSS